MENILKRDGLSLSQLKSLSYKSNMGLQLKKNLHYFNKEEMIGELISVNDWYDYSSKDLYGLALDYRIKSVQWSADFSFSVWKLRVCVAVERRFIRIMDYW